MVGGQARLVTNMEHLNVETTDGADDAIPMPELQHNLRLLVDLAEADIQRLDGKLRQEKVGASDPERWRSLQHPASCGWPHVMGPRDGHMTGGVWVVWGKTNLSLNLILKDFLPLLREGLG